MDLLSSILLCSFFCFVAVHLVVSFCCRRRRPWTRFCSRFHFLIQILCYLWFLFLIHPCRCLMCTVHFRFGRHRLCSSLVDCCHRLHHHLCSCCYQFFGIVVVVVVVLGIVFVCVFIFCSSFCVLCDSCIYFILVGVWCVWFIFGLGVIAYVVVWLIVAIAFIIAYVVVVINL